MKNQDAFLTGYKLLKIPIIDDKGRPAWPEVFPLEKIESLRQTVGLRHFASQMMLNPLQLERARLDAHSLNFYDDEFDLKGTRLGNSKINSLALYWDPSTAHKNTDGSVCVLILRDEKNRKAFIHECVYLETDEDDPHPLTTQCETVLDLMANYQIKNIAIEVNGLGNALPEILRKEASFREQIVNVQKIINKENKEKRILDAIEPLLGTGRLFAHKKIKETYLEDEMNDWTPSGWINDDGLDALAGALRIQPIPIHPITSRLRQIKAKTDFAI